MNVQRFLQGFIKVFWSYRQHVNDFKLFGAVHMLMLVLIASLMIVMFLRREKIKHKNYRKLEIVLGLILLAQQVLMYAWYGTYSTSLKEMLPMYLCRLTILFTSYTMITGKDTFRHVVYFWGIFGAILVFVDTSGYGFPHIMFFSFFVGHGTLAVSVFYMIVIKGYRPSREDFNKTLIWNGVYILIACMVNKMVDGNYNYLEQKPYMLSISAGFVKSIFYKLTILGVFELLTCILYIPAYMHQRRSKREQQIVADIDPLEDVG